MRIGDIVIHKPSGEQWLVARVCEDGSIIAAGWPCTYGESKDIDLTESCSDQVHEDLVASLRNLPSDDPRFIPPNSAICGRPTDPVGTASAYCGPDSNRPLDQAP